MMKNRKHRKLFVLATLIVFVFTSVTVSFAGTSTKKMTVYDEVLVSGKYAYCSAAKGIYKVNINTGSKKLIHREETFPVYGMKKHKGYLYFQSLVAIDSPLCRVKLSGKGFKYLASINDKDKYVISGSKIYYSAYKNTNEYTGNKIMQMSLNGKNKRKASCTIKTVYKKTNKSGYKVKTISGANYLVKPNGKKIKLCDLGY